MTSKLTREENVQAVFDLKAGYTLGLADVEILKRVARMALAAMDSESWCLPLDYLQGHKDGLEWASQLAEANHPETGDWLYDDPIELAKAIRKGPDMPPAQPVGDSEPDRNPVLAYADSYRDMAKQGVESVPIWSVITDLERNIAPLYRHAQQPVVQPVMFIDGDISSEDADKLAKVIREFNEEDERPLAKMARIIRDNPHPTNECDMPKTQPAKGLESAGWQFKSVNGDWLGLIDEHGKNQAVREGCEVREVFAMADGVNERDLVRREHADWSQATFGNVGPIGPLKHLAKEALEAAAAPGDLSEWADMQFLLWDAQRRAGITDEQITQAMIEKLAVNKQREWPEPKDGEPRLHIKEQPAPVVQCPFPCGWDNLNKLAIQDAAFVAIALVEGEPATESIRQAVIANNDRLLKAISACRAAMLAAAPQEVPDGK